MSPHFSNHHTARSHRTPYSHGRSSTSPSSSQALHNPYLLWSREDLIEHALVLEEQIQQCSFDGGSARKTIIFGNIASSYQRMFRRLCKEIKKEYSFRGYVEVDVDFEKSSGGGKKEYGHLLILFGEGGSAPSSKGPSILYLESYGGSSPRLQYPPDVTPSSGVGGFNVNHAFIGQEDLDKIQSMYVGSTSLTISVIEIFMTYTITTWIGPKICPDPSFSIKTNQIFGFPDRSKIRERNADVLPNTNLWQF